MKSLQQRPSLKDRLLNTGDKKDSLNAKISPIMQKRHSKNSGNSTVGTNQIETKAFSSPYMKQFISNNLNQLNNFPSAGEVEYKFMGNEEDSRSGKSDSNREDLVGQSMIKQKSVPLSLKTTNKHSSFQDNNLLVPSSIQEDEVEETLRSASPNLIIRSNQSRIAEWRTQKNITLDEYNEFSEHCSDYNQVEVIEDYIENSKFLIFIFNNHSM